jgi:uncharacterized protein with PIN domain
MNNYQETTREEIVKDINFRCKDCDNKLEWLAHWRNKARIPEYEYEVLKHWLVCTNCNRYIDDITQ